MKILFVCSGNTCRSPMAQALFDRIAQQKGLNVECKSAGIVTYTGNPASDNSIEVLKEVGIDITNFRSTAITALVPVLSEFDLFVPMTISHAHSLMLLGVEKSKIYIFESDVSDPYGGDIDTYRNTRDEIEVKLQGLADFVERKMQID